MGVNLNICWKNRSSSYNKLKPCNVKHQTILCLTQETKDTEQKIEQNTVYWTPYGTHTVLEAYTMVTKCEGKSDSRRQSTITTVIPMADKGNMTTSNTQEISWRDGKNAPVLFIETFGVKCHINPGLNFHYEKLFYIYLNKLFCWEMLLN